MDDRVEVVRVGYDAMAEDYLEWAARIRDVTRERRVADLLSRLQPGSQVVDLGCGAGVPSTAQLAVDHNVLGVDVSAAQLALARTNVPNAQLQQADVSTVRLPAGSVDAVTAFYSLTHVPRGNHAALFARIASWLRPGGWFLATLSAQDSDGMQDKFVGVPMYFSGFDTTENRRLIDAAGFVRVVDEVVTLDEPDGPATFLWVLARRAML